MDPPSYRERWTELRPGRLFTHRTAHDVRVGGPLYCRLEEWVEAERRVVYTTIDRSPDAISLPQVPWRMSVDVFIEKRLGEWCEGSQSYRQRYLHTERQNWMVTIRQRSMVIAVALNSNAPTERHPRPPANRLRRPGQRRGRHPLGVRAERRERARVGGQGPPAGG
jgi:hypothetical protein